MSQNANTLKGLGDVGRGLISPGFSTAGLGMPIPQPTNAQLAAALMADSEINTSKRMRHLAGKLMHHPEQDVRDLAALALRHIERREDGK